MLFYIVAYLVVLIPSIVLEIPEIGYVGIILVILLAIPSISLSIRRLHDVDKSAWFLLVSLIPFGSLYLLYLYAKAGTVGDNRYGTAVSAA